MNSLQKMLVVLIVFALFSGAVFAAQVTFQVIMSVQIDRGNFDAEADMVVVRGSFNDWSGNDATTTAIDDSIWAVAVEIADGDIEYKFVIVPGEGDDAWEDVDNRTLTIAGDDIIVDPVHWGNLGWAPTTSVEVLFQVNMQVTILQEIFDPATDLIVVRGGHGSIGNWGGAVALTNEPGTDNYAEWVEFSDIPLDTIEFKYVILTNGDEALALWESSPNRVFSPTGDEEDSDDNGFAEIETDLVYYADVGLDDILGSDVMVVFQVDARPAFAKMDDPEAFIIDVQTGDTLTAFDWIDIAGAVPLSWDWGSIPEENHAYDDGGDYDDVAGDSIFSVGIQYFMGQPRRQEWKCGINGYDVEAGFAMNHYADIEDDEDTYIVMEAFGSQDTLYSDWWEYAVHEVPVEFMPVEFTVEQNYPNPFNPTTNIAFNLPERADVTLKIFNITGQEVFREEAGILNAGRYSLTFEAHNFASGVYVYTVEAGQYTASRKMMLLK